MRKASIRLQELRRKIYSKAKAEKCWKFWGLYCHLCKKEVLEEAYRLAKANCCFVFDEFLANNEL